VLLDVSEENCSDAKLLSAKKSLLNLIVKFKVSTLELIESEPIDDDYLAINRCEKDMFANYITLFVLAKHLAISLKIVHDEEQRKGTLSGVQKANDGVTSPKASVKKKPTISMIDHIP
jgi:hypothetical protein